MKATLLPLVLMLCASVAVAEPPAPSSEVQKASELVNKLLLTALKKVEAKRKRFSRAAPVPVERRLRVLDVQTQADARGKMFVRFAIDVRRAWGEQSPWEKDSLTGCAYPSEREVFVRRGAAYLPASSMLGKDAEARRDVCRPARER